MKSRRPLTYQATDYDCVPTAFVNALVWMLERKVPPEIVKFVWESCLGGDCRGGTSDTRIEALAHYLSITSKNGDFPGFNLNVVHMEGGPPESAKKMLDRCLDAGGCAIVSVWYDTKIQHVSLCLGRHKSEYFFFDSYWRYAGFRDSDCVQWKPYGFLDESVKTGLTETVARHSNTRVHRRRLFSRKVQRYSMEKASVTFFFPAD